MPEVDYIIKNLAVQQEAEFSIDQLYKALSKWCNNHEYILSEREYDDVARKNFKIKWVTFKEVDDYTRLKIDVKISGVDITTVKKDNKTLNKGRIKVSFDAYIERDYEEKWENTGIGKFLRSLYDKFIIPSKSDKYKEELKDDVYNAYNEVKALLELNNK